MTNESSGQAPARFAAELRSVIALFWAMETVPQVGDILPFPQQN